MNRKITGQMMNCNGFPVFVPNTSYSFNGYHISYNNSGSGIRDYGCDTTALVPADHSFFYILNGDHRKAYFDLQDKGFDACLEYFKSQYRLINELSDIPGQSLPISEYLPKAYK